MQITHVLKNQNFIYFCKLIIIQRYLKKLNLPIIINLHIRSGPTGTVVDSPGAVLIEGEVVDVIVSWTTAELVVVVVDSVGAVDSVAAVESVGAVWTVDSV